MKAGSMPRTAPSRESNYRARRFAFRAANLEPLDLVAGQLSGPGYLARHLHGEDGSRSAEHDHCRSDHQRRLHAERGLVDEHENTVTHPHPRRHQRIGFNQERAGIENADDARVAHADVAPGELVDERRQ